jgi:hypothetical protein
VHAGEKKGMGWATSAQAPFAQLHGSQWNVIEAVQSIEGRLKGDRLIAVGTNVIKEAQKRIRSRRRRETISSS